MQVQGPDWQQPAVHSQTRTGRASVEVGRPRLVAGAEKRASADLKLRAQDGGVAAATVPRAPPVSSGPLAAPSLLQGEFRTGAASSLPSLSAVFPENRFASLSTLESEAGSLHTNNHSFISLASCPLARRCSGAWSRAAQQLPYHLERPGTRLLRSETAPGNGHQLQARAPGWAPGGGASR